MTPVHRATIRAITLRLLIEAARRRKYTQKKALK
jgi:hypothetical protein